MLLNHEALAILRCLYGSEMVVLGVDIGKRQMPSTDIQENGQAILMVNGSIAFIFSVKICLAVKRNANNKFNVGEWVMGMKYSGFTRIVLYSNIYPIDSCTDLFNNPAGDV